ncbi:helicase associated domain-containing protein [Streptomyces sp. NPDC006510]|uniref:helicase associated domain-containing protein n=1 Tax=Streptomyces sp. NPDC006510 TaxID=3155600 RepID=UPI0033BD2239
MSVTAPSARPPSSLLFPSAQCVVGVRPLNRETTLSFVGRLAGRMGLSARDLIAEFFAFRNRPPMSSLAPDGEVYFNAQARQCFAALSGVPAKHLERALPAWSQLEPKGHYDSGPAATFFRVASFAPTTQPCPGCTAVRADRPEPARRYTQAHQQICARHLTWLCATASGHGVPEGMGRLRLAGVPDTVQARGRHLALLRGRSEAAEAFRVAQAVTASWWAASWPQETIWPRRLEALARTNPGVPAELSAVRDAVAYPDTVALARLLASRFWQQRLLAEARGHRPHVPGDVPLFLREAAQRLERPWLAGVLADVTDGPFTGWLQACWRSRAGENPKARTMWWVAPAHRPLTPQAVCSTLPHSSPASPEPETEPIGGSSAQGFARGLGLARAYAAEHGHLCIPYRHRREGFQLGLWLANQRATGPQLSPARSKALAGLDPWWNPPWGTRWQRHYLRAREVMKAGNNLDPVQGFPGTSTALGSWLYRQCQHYDRLHPQQRRLLAMIGIGAEAAGRAQPRRRNLAELSAHRLDQARAYYAQHGHLCALAGDMQDGFAVGQALANLRVQARNGRLEADVAQQLNAMDPWWAPPWSSGWQCSYYTVRTQVHAGHPLDPAGAFSALDDELGQWLYTQCVTYPSLAAGQRRQLAAIGLTKQRAATARPDPDTEKPSLETGLHYARSYASLHGHLDVPPAHRHEGFALGAWLTRQRSQADRHRAKFTSPWPAGPLLSAIDPWWNPPWPTAWQASYRNALALVTGGLRLSPQQGFPGTPDWTGQWLYQQCTAYDRLHPEQRQRLARIGIHPENARTARPRRVTQQDTFNRNLAHARAYAAQHGHLAAPANALHNGHRLGPWLSQQRQRAASNRLPADRAQALHALDPYWNPPWDIRWQRDYRSVETATAGLPIDTRTGFKDLPRPAAKWLFTQCVAYNALHTEQHTLLARLGITADDAHALRPAPLSPAPPNAPAPRPQPNAVPSSLNAGLPYARSYSAAHHGLGSADFHTHHDGFPLGWWLYTQRKRALAHVRRTGLPWPHEEALASLDPYWNPSWHISWQRMYTRIRLLNGHAPTATPVDQHPAPQLAGPPPRPSDPLAHHRARPAHHTP